ncbi:MAG: hypothetical protein HOQ22_08560, partial [Nocardioidaceae bacterium]|nr:hypothetical protein [Nocardioidaceae bacterium]
MTRTGDRHWVLVADDGSPISRTALGTERALGAAGFRPVVTVAQGPTLASTSRWCAGTVRVPVDDPADWVEAVRAEARERAALVVVPASDSAVVDLDLPGAALVDKRVARARAEAAGLRVPEEIGFRDAEELHAAADGLPYPLVVKPALRFRADPFKTVLAASPADLAAVPTGQALLVQPHLDGPVTAFDGLVLGGRLVAALHQRYLRTWPRRAGGAAASVTIPPDNDLEEKVLQLVDGHEGIVEVELVGGRVVDVNPRAYGSIALATRCGVNLPALWCRSLLEGPPARVVRAEPGRRYRWLDGDLRSVVGDLRAGELGP